MNRINHYDACYHVLCPTKTHASNNKKGKKITEEGIEMKEHKSTGVWLERKEREMEVPVTEAISQISDPTTEATKNDDFFKRGKTHRRQDKCVCVYLVFNIYSETTKQCFFLCQGFGLWFGVCLFTFASLLSLPIHSLSSPNYSYPILSQDFLFPLFGLVWLPNIVYLFITCVVIITWLIFMIRSHLFNKKVSVWFVYCSCRYSSTKPVMLINVIKLRSVIENIK